ncbi:winged helix-turn-helix domain-containing protein [Lentzea sp. BCCO 10_0856]|uniref:Winged helix-turn-helix domain-containing protein n=1 Tax=Lentzea miocenica TaxID=3095431 RepID=A0ABU4TCG2_9PSEU|nr:winged helix-turn-helix domain-containing protein [Lentzea sp. BCCO 10_0856]MDX8035870.1 winged helix-turn-helix domain-containing protein [Lentzea sp. BCCO 10_0856]
MTAKERQEFDANPLWSTDSQILWLFGEQDEDTALLTVAEISGQLALDQSTVLYALRQLRDEGKAATCQVDRREAWGTGDQVVEWLRKRRLEAQRIESEREQARGRVTKANEALADAATQLREACAGRGVSVSTFGGFGTDSGEPRKLSLLLSVVDPEAAAWLVGRMSRPVPGEDAPSAEQWAEHAGHFEELVSCFEWAGWSEHENDYFTEYDDETGPVLYTTLHRTCMAFDVEYHPSTARLRLLPHEYPGGWPQIFSMLDDEVMIELDGELGEQKELITEHAGALGLLDATRVEVDPDADVSLRQFMDVQLTEYVFEEFARYRQKPLPDAAGDLDGDTYLQTYFATVVDMFGRGVLPDLVPDAVVHGIAAWCWRNDTAVEAWHVPDDVLMARINIAVTKKITDYVDLHEGVDWLGLEAALTDPEWTLPDGRKISGLFEEGWQEVRDSVSEKLMTWRRLDEDLLGPAATSRLLTIGGSTSYTWQWWGQGRWTAICRAIVEEAVAGGIALPKPYDGLDLERLVADLAEPDQLDDEALEWLIDMPAAGVDGPRGLRFHHASKPISRIVEPVNWPTE